MSKIVPFVAKEAPHSENFPESDPNMGKLLYLLEEKRRIVPQYFELEIQFIPPADRKHRCSNKACQETATLRLVWYDTYLKKTAPDQKIEYSCGRRKCTSAAGQIAVRNCRQ